MRPVTLSFVTLMHYYPWGGSEELWHQTAFYANENNVKTEAHVYELAKGHKRVNELEQVSIPVHYRKNHYSLKDRIFKKLGVEKLNASSQTSYWERHLKNKRALYIISQGTCHDCLRVPDLFTALEKNGCSYVLVNQHNYEHKPLGRQDMQRAKKIFQNAEKVFFVSQRNLDVAEHQIASNIGNGEVVFNPVKAKAYVKFPNNSDPILNVACVARLECFNKGQDILLKVLSKKKWKERQIVVNFYGNGPDKELIESLAVFYRVDHMIKFCGYLENVADIWELNSCLVMASFAEGTPLSLLEAMACGRAAVVTNVGGNAEWITNDVNGFIAGAPTPALLDDALEKMWQNRHRLEEMGKIAHETYLSKYPHDAISYFYDRLMAISL